MAADTVKLLVPAAKDEIRIPAVVETDFSPSGCTVAFLALPAGMPLVDIAHRMTIVAPAPIGFIFRVSLVTSDTGQLAMSS